MKATITFEIDTNDLSHVNDRYLAALWHIAQANPADSFASPEAGLLAETIGREIIKRWLSNTSPELWHHQGHHFALGQLHLHKNDGSVRVGTSDEPRKHVSKNGKNFSESAGDVHERSEHEAGLADPAPQSEGQER